MASFSVSFQKPTNLWSFQDSKDFYTKFIKKKSNLKLHLLLNIHIFFITDMTHFLLMIFLYSITYVCYNHHLSLQINLFHFKIFGPSKIFVFSEDCSYLISVHFKNPKNLHIPLLNEFILLDFIINHLVNKKLMPKRESPIKNEVYFFAQILVKCQTETI